MEFDSTKYLYFDKNITLNIYLGKHYVLCNDFNEQNPKSENRDYVLNGTAVEIMKLINGQNSLDDIIRILSNIYDEKTSVVKILTTNFLKTLISNYGLKINYSDKKIEKNLIIKNIQNLYPTVASIEITYRCNLKCLHCYGEYGSNNDVTMSFEEIKKLLKDLRGIGVKIIEFTGGEITMHPDLNQILLEAVNQNFDSIALLTNGVLLSEEVCNTIIDNRDKVIIQIDLHSLKDEYLTWFTKIPNTLDIIKRNINKLNKNGVILRIATIATKRNMDEIEQIADYVHELGIEHYSVGQVINLGRAIENSKNPDDNELFYDTTEGLLSFFTIIKKIDTKYPNFLNLIEDSRFFKAYKVNCGCLTSNVTITPNGDIKICMMDNQKYTNWNFGNVFGKNIKEIYDYHKEIILDLLQLERPKLDSDECANCEHKYFCANCILRGLICAQKKGESCKWYTNLVTEKLKDTLFSYQK